MNVGLLGYGFMGGAHLAALAAQPGITLKAIASRTRPGSYAPIRGNMNLKIAKLPEDVVWHPDWKTIVQDPEIDAVDICLPTHLHREVALAALASGKHVLCEKPLALTPADCDDLLEAAASTGCILMAAHILRFMEPYRYATAFVRAGQEIKRCALRRSTGYPQWNDWLADAERSGGAILDLLIHDLDQVLSWFGAPHSVSAVSMGLIDTACVTLNYPGGFRATVEGGWLSAEVPFAQSFVLETDDQELVFTNGELHRKTVDLIEKISLPEQNLFTEEIAYFLSCCRTGDAPVLCPPAECAQAVRLAMLARLSREQNGKEFPWT